MRRYVVDFSLFTRGHKSELWPTAHLVTQSALFLPSEELGVKTKWRMRGRVTQEEGANFYADVHFEAHPLKNNTKLVQNFNLFLLLILSLQLIITTYRQSP